MTIKHKLWLTIAFAMMGVCFMGIANATDVRVTCVAPTKNTDGSTIGGTITYNLYGALQGATKQKLNAGAGSCDFTRTNVASGVQEYYVTAVVAGVESSPSNTASVIVPPPVATPNAPTGTVVVTITVTP
jgi:hypothetical protein